MAASSSSSYTLTEEGKKREEYREEKENAGDDGRKKEVETEEKIKQDQEGVSKEGNENEHRQQLYAPKNEEIKQQQENRVEGAQFIQPVKQFNYSLERIFNLDALTSFMLPHDSSSEDDSSESEAGSVITVEDTNDRRSDL